MDINIDVANNLKIEKYVFMKLCEVLNKSFGLKRGKNVPIIESVAVFFITLGHAFGNRMVKKRFQHSSENVSKWFRIVLDSICHMAVDIL